MVEVPPGPPVMSPIVAEVYGPDEAGQDRPSPRRCASSLPTPRTLLRLTIGGRQRAETPAEIDQSKAAQLGVAQRDVVATMRIGLTGMAVTPFTTSRPNTKCRWC